MQDAAHLRIRAPATGGRLQVEMEAHRRVRRSRPGQVRDE